MSATPQHSPKYDTSLLRTVGEDVFISANVDIRRPNLLSVGSHVAIDTGFYITTEATLGDYIHIGPYVIVIGGPNTNLRVGNFVNITPGVKLLCASDSFSGGGLVSAPGIPDEFLNEIDFSSIIIEDFASICAGATVLPGVTIAEGSVIGANSLVTKNTEPWTVYAGSPARPIKKRPSEAMRKYAKELGY